MRFFGFGSRLSAAEQALRASRDLERRRLSAAKYCAAFAVRAARKRRGARECALDLTPIMRGLDLDLEANAAAVVALLRSPPFDFDAAYDSGSFWERLTLRW